MTNKLRIPVRTKIRGVVFILLLLLGLTAAHSGTMEVSAIGVKEKTGEMTITLGFTEVMNYRSFTLGNPPRLVLDIPGATLKEARTIEVKNEVVETIEYLQYRPDTVRIVVNLTQPAESRVRKAGKKLLLYFSLPREVKARLQTEERAKAKAEEEMKKKLAAEERARIKWEKEEKKRLALARETELKAGEEEKRRLEAERKAREKGEEERRRAEEKAKRLLDQRVKRETNFRAREVLSEKRLVEEAAYQEAKKEKKEKKEIESHLARGEKHYRTGQFDEAIREFEAVLALEPEDEEARNYLALAREGREEERRLQEAKQGEKEKETKLLRHLDKGKEYYNQGLFTEAIEEWKKILSLTVPSDPRRQNAEQLIHKAELTSLGVESEEVEGEWEMERKKAILKVEESWLPPKRTEAEVKSEETITEAKRRLAEKAKFPVSLDFEGAHLRDILTFLAATADVNIVLDEAIFSAGGIAAGGEEPRQPPLSPEGDIPGPEEGEAISPRVTIYLKNVPLIEALDLILRQKGLRYRLEENIIWITTPERLAEEAMVTKVYHLSTGVGTFAEFEESEGFGEESESIGGG